MKRLGVACVTATCIFIIIIISMQNAPLKYQNLIPSSSEHYLRNAASDTGTTNAVAAVLFDYRALDTIGEVLVIVATAVGVSLSFGARVLARTGSGLSPFVKLSVSLVIPIVFIISLHTIFLSAGGGFKGGVMLGSLSFISLVVYGSGHDHEFLGVNPWQKAMSVAILGIITLTLLPLLAGRPLLTNTVFNLGSRQLSSSTLISIFTGFAIGMSVAKIFHSLARIDAWAEGGDSE